VHSDRHEFFTHWAWVVPVLLLITALATPRLGETLWGDEYRTMWYAGAVPQFGPAPVTELVERIAANRFQAPLYYLTLSGWARFVGWGDVPLRALSLFAGLLAVTVLYRLARRSFGGTVALYAAATCSVSAFFVNYLHEMRTYTPLLLLLVTLLWCYDDLTRGHHRARNIVAISLLTAAALYSHYYAAFPLAVLCLYQLSFGRGRAHFWPALGALVVGGVVFLPWTQVLFAALTETTSDSRQADNLGPLALVVNVLHDYSSGNIALVGLLLAAGIAARRPGTRFYVFWVIVGVALVLLIAPFFLVNEVRYLLFLWPGLAIIIGVGIDFLARQRTHAAALLVVWALTATWGVFSPREQQRIHPWYISPMREATLALTDLIQPGDFVLHIAPPRLYSSRREIVPFYMEPLGAEGDMLLDQWANPDAGYTADLANITRGQPHLWTVYDPDRRHWRVGPLEDTLLPNLGYDHCGVVRDGPNVHLTYWTTPDAQPAEQYAFLTPKNTPVRVGLLWPLSPTDTTLHLNVGWYAPDTLPLYSLALQIEDESGALIYSSDVGLDPITHGCHIEHISTANLPAGTYTLKLAVYNWGTEERLPPTGAESTDNRITLGTFTR
jgi:hypothetical protein